MLQTSTIHFILFPIMLEKWLSAFVIIFPPWPSPQICPFIVILSHFACFRIFQQLFFPLWKRCFEILHRWESFKWSNYATNGTEAISHTGTIRLGLMFILTVYFWDQNVFVCLCKCFICINSIYSYYVQLFKEEQTHWLKMLIPAGLWQKMKYEQKD